MPLHLVTSAADLDEIARLFREYESSLDVDLCFQGFEEELASLPGEYGAPDGRLYLLTVDGQTAGCAALRRFDPDTAEMKRLYVRPEFRASGLGLQLAQQIIADARAAGWRRLVLDTLPSMGKAIELYLALGFRNIEPYRDNPVPGARYLGLDLRE